MLMTAARAHTLIVGLGQTGMSALRFLDSIGESVAVADSRERPPFLGQLQREYPRLTVSLGAFRPAEFRTYRRIVLSPGVPLATPAVQAALAAGGEVIGKARTAVEHELAAEQDRLIALAEVNANVRDDEIERLAARRQALLDHLASTRVRLDAMRLWPPTRTRAGADLQRGKRGAGLYGGPFCR